MNAQAAKMRYVLRSASILGHKLEMDKARKIAERFSLGELQRVLERILMTGRRRVRAEELQVEGLDMVVETETTEGT